ncbi:MAG: A/G-specific adenine glycosylase [bacterium]
MEATLKKLFRQNLLSWFSRNARVLPWREAPSLYKTVVSEFMLQQTQVKTVLPFFNRWLEHFPNFETLAESDVHEVIKLWEGLGYYSRAKNLQSFAQNFIKNPAKSFSDLLKFKGVGSYTAAAIASIAFHEKVAVVDGNVIRVLARIFNMQAVFQSKDSAVKLITPLANELIAPEHPGDFNEAIMELGALICTKSNPKCDACPLKDLCEAFKQNTVDKCPRFVQLARKKCLKKRLWLIKNGSLLLEPSRVGGSNTLWELPEITPERETYCELSKLIFTGRRSIGTTTFIEEIYTIAPTVEELTSLKIFSQCTYFLLNDVRKISLSGPHKRWIQEILKR